MFGSEAIDLSKMAASVLLTCLLVGAVLLLFYRLYTPTSKRIDDMQAAANSSKTERLYELRDRSDDPSKKNPLVSNVISSLQEFDETDLLYVSVYYPGVANPTVFTYTDIDETMIGGSGFKLENCTTPTTDAAQSIARYSERRCAVRLNNIDYGGGDGNFLAVTIIIDS